MVVFSITILRVFPVKYSAVWNEKYGTLATNNKLDVLDFPVQSDEHNVQNNPV